MRSRAERLRMVGQPARPKPSSLTDEKADAALAEMVAAAGGPILVFELPGGYDVHLAPRGARFSRATVRRLEVRGMLRRLNRPARPGVVIFHAVARPGADAPAPRDEDSQK